MARLICILLLALLSTNAFAQKATDKPLAFSDSLLYGGCWFVPHNAGINLRFSQYGNFEFQDYDKDKSEEVMMKGKYLLDGHNLWLIYNDRAKQKFYFYRGEGADDNFYIKGYPLKTSAYYFVHGQCD